MRVGRLCGGGIGRSAPLEQSDQSGACASPDASDHDLDTWNHGSGFVRCARRAECSGMLRYCGLAPGRVVKRAAGIVCASFGADGGLLGAWLVLYRYEVVEVEDARLES